MLDRGRTFRFCSGAVECDSDGPVVAGFRLLVRIGSGGWALRAISEIERELARIYGVDIDASRKMSGLSAVAVALNRGELARAQIATLLLKFPDPGEMDTDDPLGLHKVFGLPEADWIAKDRDPAKHPGTGSGPNPGWFATTDGGASNSPTEASEPKANRRSEDQVAEIKPDSSGSGVASNGGGGQTIVSVGAEEPEERSSLGNREEEGKMTDISSALHKANDGIAPKELRPEN